MHTHTDSLLQDLLRAGGLVGCTVGVADSNTNKEEPCPGGSHNPLGLSQET